MNNLTVFTNEEFGAVRTVVIDNQPWFVGKDVAAALKYENPQKALRDHVDTEDKKMGERNVTPAIIDRLGREQYPAYINESGMYSLVLSSKLPAAKKFKRWITSEVLPQIRQTGNYIVEPQDEKTILSRAVLIAQAQILQLEQAVTEQAQIIEEAQPAIRFKAACDKSDGMTMEEVAKTLNIKGYGRNNLFKLMYRKGIFANHRPDKPKQRYMDQGLFLVELKPAAKINHDGERVVFMAAQAKVTPKGFDWIEILIRQEIEEMAAEAEEAKRQAEEEAAELERLEELRPRLRRVK